MYQIIDGKSVSNQIKQEIADEVADIQKKGGKIPHLVAILVGTDGASETYVSHKEKACENIDRLIPLLQERGDRKTFNILAEKC